MKQSVLVILTVALLVNGLVTLAVVQNTEAGLTPDEFNALTDSIFGATGVPGRGPSIPNIPGGVPGIPSIQGGVHGIPNIPGGVPGIPSIQGSVHGIPNIPGGVPGIPNIHGGPPDNSGFPSNIFGP